MGLGLPVPFGGLGLPVPFGKVDITGTPNPPTPIGVLICSSSLTSVNLSFSVFNCISVGSVSIASTNRLYQITNSFDVIIL